MKLVCDCGSIHEFSNFNEDTQEYNKYDDTIGATYHTIENVTFWIPDHKALGILCHDCDKAIWIFM